MRERQFKDDSDDLQRLNARFESGIKRFTWDLLQSAQGRTAPGPWLHITGDSPEAVITELLRGPRKSQR